MNEGRGVSALGPPAKSFIVSALQRSSAAAAAPTFRSAALASMRPPSLNSITAYSDGRQSTWNERRHLAGLRALGIGDVAPSRRSSPRLASQLASMRVPRDPHHEQRPSVRRIS